MILGDPSESVVEETCTEYVSYTPGGFCDIDDAVCLIHTSDYGRDYNGNDIE